MAVALVDSDLISLIEKRAIRSEHDLTRFIQPASIDIPIGKTAYLVKQKFLPFGKSVRDLLNTFALERLDLTSGAILFKGQTYLIPCLTFDLPNDLEIRTSPKSSIGRIDLLVRSVFDHTGLYDRVPTGGSGELWIEVTPQSFNVRVQEGIALNQLRTYIKNAEKTDVRNERITYDEHGEPLDATHHSPSKIILSLSARPNTIAGYESVHTNEVIDLTKTYTLNHNRFFREIATDEDGRITIEKDRFYILSTKERIAVPHHLSAEMVPFFHLVGELRAHYAGFFDPGFGWGRGGCSAVLEVRPQENLTAYHGQPICLMEFSSHTKAVSVPYGEAGNNYQVQIGPRPAKYFTYDIGKST